MTRSSSARVIECCWLLNVPASARKMNTRCHEAIIVIRFLQYCHPYTVVAAAAVAAVVAAAVVVTAAFPYATAATPVHLPGHELQNCPRRPAV